MMRRKAVGYIGALGFVFVALAATARAADCSLTPNGEQQEGAFRQCGLLLETCSSCWTDTSRSNMNTALNNYASEDSVYANVQQVLKTLELDINQQPVPTGASAPSALMQAFNDANTVDAVCRSFAIDPDLSTLDVEDELGDRFVENCHLLWRVSRYQFATILGQHRPLSVKFSSDGSSTAAVNWVLRVTQKNPGVDIDNLGIAWNYSASSRAVVIDGWYNIDTRKIARELIYENLTVESNILAYLNTTCDDADSAVFKACSAADTPYETYATASPLPASIMKKHISEMFDHPVTGSAVNSLNATRKAQAKASALALWDQFVDSSQAHGYKSVASRMARKLRTPMMCGAKKIVKGSSASGSIKSALNNELNREALLGARAYRADGSVDNGAAYCELIGLKYN